MFHVICHLIDKSKKNINKMRYNVKTVKGNTTISSLVLLNVAQNSASIIVIYYFFSRLHHHVNTHTSCYTFDKNDLFSISEKEGRTKTAADIEYPQNVQFFLYI